MVQSQPGRGAIIAAIHAFADWLAEHPETPAPTSLRASAILFSDQIPDEATRIGDVVEFGTVNGARLEETNQGVNAQLRVFAQAEHGINIDYNLWASFDKPQRRYVEG